MVTGSVGLVLVGINVGQQIYKQYTEEDDGVLVRLFKSGLRILRGEDEEKKAQKIAVFCLELALGLTVVAWFITGELTLWFCLH